MLLFRLKIYYEHFIYINDLNKTFIIFAKALQLNLFQ